MQFALDLSTLAAPLAGAVAVADRTHPVLSSVLVSASDGQVRFQASDSLAIVSVVDVASAEVRSGGRLLTHGRRWNQVARALPPGPVTVESVSEGSTIVRAGRTTVRLLSHNPADYPEQPVARDSELTSVDGAALAELLGRIALTISPDETRINLNGALLLSDGAEVTMVSSDGHRLTKCTSELTGPKLDKYAIIPRRGIESIRRLLAGTTADCSWGVARGHLFVRVGRSTMAVKLTPGVTFPPYGNVIPQSHTGMVEVDRAALQLVLRQAIVFAPNNTTATKFELRSDEIRVLVDNRELGKAQLSVDSKYNGDPLTIGLNAGYVLEALDAVTSARLAIEVRRELEPIVVRPWGESHTLVVLMPMRTDE